MIEGVASIQL